jgi:serine/threonine protein kinase
MANGNLTVLSPGFTIEGKYRVLHFLAEGGMGTTWVGESLRTGGLVVAKEPKVTGQRRTDQLNMEKLQIEADILKVLENKRIVRYVDLVTVKSVPILLTGFVNGDLLETVASREPQDEKAAIRYTSDLLDAVGYIHSLNIIHRDIRPKNILLDPQRKDLTLIDFGTAKFFHRQLDTPEAIISPGGYSPPEHYKLGYSPQGDLWSVGGTLFFLLTGQHPVLVLGAYPQNSQPADPRRLRPRISDRISQIVIKATQANPSRRFLNAVEMKQVLLGSPQRARNKPVLSVRNVEVPISTPRILVGRNEQFDSLFDGETLRESIGNLAILEEKPSVEVSGDKTVIKVVDPGNYISRLHAEIFEEDETWYLKDLGSLNGTAILGDSGWQPIHLGHKQEGPPNMLSGHDIISLGYNSVRGPYLVLTFMVA